MQPLVLNHRYSLEENLTGFAAIHILEKGSSLNGLRVALFINCAISGVPWNRKCGAQCISVLTEPCSSKCPLAAVVGARFFCQMCLPSRASHRFISVGLSLKLFPSSYHASSYRQILLALVFSKKI